MRWIILLLALAAPATLVQANAVAVVDAVDGTYLQLLSSDVTATVENQVAIVTHAQTFRNELGADTTVTFAFPLPEDASATGLRWYIAGLQYDAVVSASPQDPGLPGTGSGSLPDPDLLAYVGETPLYVPVTQTVPADSTIRFELTYAQLLPYEFGDVTLRCPNDYGLIQTAMVERQSLRFELQSPRTISFATVLSSHPVVTSQNDGATALLETAVYEATADEDYAVRYSLALDELGLFSLSTTLPDSVTPDEHGGYFLFVAEPDPSETADVIDKVFTLIIDRSGSMSGDKIVQARDAARYVVENLNEGDRFNIVSYNSEIVTFRSEHVDYNPENKTAALQYISGLSAGGSTSISGAFGAAVPQFSTASSETANIIVFFTDGYQTSGITDTGELIAYVNNLIASTETDIHVFTFGIGSSVNSQLLTEVARSNHGIAAFLGADELGTRITDFYRTIRNPVLLDTGIGFSTAGVTEIFPNPLPNLYKGQQMVVSGRYTNAAPTTVTLSGTAFGSPVEYQYEIALLDSVVERYRFLPKVWAKQKIEHLLVEYYTLGETTPEAEGAREAIVGLSLRYGVVSPFTSYDSPTQPTGGATEIQDAERYASSTPAPYELIGNFPNPFNPTTTIRFRVNADLHESVAIRVYNVVGQLIAVLDVRVDGSGVYEVVWNGMTDSGTEASSGVYVYVVDFGNGLLAGRMQLLR